MLTSTAIRRGDPFQVAERLAIADESLDGWCTATDAEARLRHSIGDPAHARLVATWLERLERLRIAHPLVRFVTHLDADYPLALRTSPERPAVLFIDGTVPATPAVAVVGSREADDSRLRDTAAVAEALVSGGFAVTSGLARGVDGAAHRAALEARGSTIAVVGTGIDQLFPPEHADLDAAIRRRGAVISQFPPGAGRSKTSFPARNAVIAGLSVASVIIAASERSGSRIEIKASLRLGRPVVLWGPGFGGERWVDKLLRNQAAAVANSLDEVLELTREAAVA